MISPIACYIYFTNTINRVAQITGNDYFFNYIFKNSIKIFVLAKFNSRNTVLIFKAKGDCVSCENFSVYQ